MKILCVLSRYNYGDPRRGEGYEYVNFIPALRRLGHTVTLFDNWERLRYRNFSELNEALLQAVERERPDVVFSVLVHYEIWRETWLILRDAGITATVNWATDDSYRYAQFSRFVAPTFHAFTTTYPPAFRNYLEDGIDNVLLTQWAADASSMRPPLPASQCIHPVSFVGTAHGERAAWIHGLRQFGIEIECFGHGWKNGPVPSSQVREIIRKSVISLNFAGGGKSWKGIIPRPRKQIKARTFEVPGAGGFLLTERVEGLDNYYLPEKEVATFIDLNEAEQRIRYFLSHVEERDAIAAAGYERTRKEHTYDFRFADVLSFALQQRDRHFSKSGASLSACLDWKKFEIAAKRHRLARPQRLAKHILIAASKMLWGAERGPRAARRLIYELSWRLAGARTYSASGLPGRMFYEAS